MSILNSFILNDKYQIKDQLGKGSYGDVYAAVNRESGDQVAIKQITFQKPLLDDEKLAEATNLKIVHNDHIISPKQIFYDPFEASLNIVLQRCHSSLRSLIEQRKVFTSIEFRNFIVQITSAFLQLENKNMMHLDLKPENILMVSQNRSHFKICDFGCSQISQIYEFFSYKKDVFGTIEYLAPQQYLENNQLKVRTSADIWSFGVILYEMMFWNLPFCSHSNQIMSRQEIYHFYNKQNYQISFASSSTAPKEVIQLMKLMLKSKPSQRISWNEVKYYLKDKMGVEDHQFLNIRQLAANFKIAFDIYVSFAYELKERIEFESCKFWKKNKAFLLKFLKVFVNYAIKSGQKFINTQSYRQKYASKVLWKCCLNLIEQVQQLRHSFQVNNPEEQDERTILRYLEKFNNKVDEQKNTKQKIMFLYTFSEELIEALKDKKSPFLNVFQFSKSHSIKFNIAKQAKYLKQYFIK